MNHFSLRVSRLQLLYTGDFSRQEDRHLMAAEIPSVKPDILIIVCQIMIYSYKTQLYLGLWMNVVILPHRSQRMAPTFMKRGRSVKLGSVTRSTILSTEKAAV